MECHYAIVDGEGAHASEVDAPIICEGLKEFHGPYTEFPLRIFQRQTVYLSYVLDDRITRLLFLVVEADLTVWWEQRLILSIVYRFVGLGHECPYPWNGDKVVGKKKVFYEKR